MKLSRWILLSMIFIFIGSNTLAAPKCKSIFPKFKMTVKIQESIEASISALAAFKLDLDLKQTEGQSTIELTALTANYVQKENELVAYLEGYDIMTRDDLVKKIKTEIKDLQLQRQADQKRQIRDEKEEARRVKKHTREIEKIVHLTMDGRQAIFNKILPGSFKMGALGNQVDVTITKPFEMMATKVTQEVWAKATTYLQKHIAMAKRVEVDPSNRKDPLFAVDKVSYNEIQSWISALNKLSQWGHTEEIRAFIPSHKKGDKYRLPTEAEWEFVLRGRGLYNEQFHFGSDKSLAKDYGWCVNNTSRPQRVGLKLPVIVDGYKFYDMVGHSVEWVADWYHEDLPGGVDPRPAQGTERVMRSSAYRYGEEHMASDYRSKAGPDEPINDHGFRLVREARP